MNDIDGVTLTAIAIVFTLLLFVSIQCVLAHLGHYRDKKYHRRYMRTWRAKRVSKELRKIKEWRNSVGFKINK